MIYNKGNVVEGESYGLTSIVKIFLGPYVTKSSKKIPHVRVLSHYDC